MNEEKMNSIDDNSDVEKNICQNKEGGSFLEDDSANYRYELTFYDEDSDSGKTIYENPTVDMIEKLIKSLSPTEGGYLILEPLFEMDSNKFLQVAMTGNEQGDLDYDGTNNNYIIETRFEYEDEDEYRQYQCKTNDIEEVITLFSDYLLLKKIPMVHLWREITNILSEESEEMIDRLLILGREYEEGKILRRDYYKAFDIYSQCASYGNLDAINNVGWMLMNGLGVEKNVSRAIFAFKRAADLNSALAMVNLGNFYERLADKGYDWDKNCDDNISHKKALDWYRKAANLGYTKGIYNYAVMIHDGRGERKNYKKAYELFKSIRKYEHEAYFFLGLYNQEGFGRRKDYKKAFHYYILGIDAGDSYCANQLGVMFGCGIGVEKNLEYARLYYMKAYYLGDPLGATNVGWYYENGEGVEKNIETAVKWYARAAMKREPNAIEGLERIKPELLESLETGEKDDSEPYFERFNSSEIITDLDESLSKEKIFLTEDDICYQDDSIVINLKKLEAIFAESMSIKTDTFSDTLFKYIDEKRMTPPEVYKGACLDRKLFSKMQDKYYVPKKSTIFALLISLRLNIKEAELLLNSAGFSFTPWIELDVYIRLFIEHGYYDIDGINEILLDAGLQLLGTRMN